MRKKIAIILTTKSLENDARVIKTSKTLGKKHDVTVFFIKPDKFVNPFYPESNVKVVPIEYTESFIHKLLRHTFFVFEYKFMLDEVVNEKFDIVYCNDLPSLYIGVYLKKKYNTRLIYDSHEIYLETINQFYGSTGNIIKKFLFVFLINLMKTIGYYYEKKWMNYIDEFITVNESLSDYFYNKYNLEKKPHVIMNFPNLYELTETKGVFRNNAEDKIVLYQGNLNSGRGLLLLVEAVKFLPQNYRLFIIGNGILLDEMKNKAKNMGLTDRVIFLGVVPNKELLNYTQEADVGINLLEPFNVSKQLASPNKLFEYIQAEIPSVNSHTIENKKIIDKYDVGVLTENEPEKIANAIVYAVDNKDYYVRRCRMAKQDLSWERQEEKLLEII